MSQFAKKPAAFVGVLVLFALVPLVWSMRSARASSPQGQGAGAHLDLALIRAGLDASALAAAGVTVMQVSTVAQNGGTALGANSLAALDQAVGAARVAHDELERKVQSGKATQEEVTSLAQRTQALAAAETARDEVINSVFAGATQQLSANQRALLDRIRTNRRSWGLPIEFLAVDRTEAEWVELRKALSNETIAARNGDEPNATCQALLSSARANQTVAAAKTAHDTNLAAVTSAWTAATSN